MMTKVGSIVRVCFNGYLWAGNDWIAPYLGPKMKVQQIRLYDGGARWVMAGGLWFRSWIVIKP